MNSRDNVLISVVVFRWWESKDSYKPRTWRWLIDQKLNWAQLVACGMEVAPERSLADRLQAVWDESQQFFYGFTLEQQKQSPSISSRNLSTRTVPTTAARNRITNNAKTTDTSNGIPTTASSPGTNAPSIDFVENQLEIAKQLTKSTLDLVKLSLATSNDDFIVSVRGKFF